MNSFALAILEDDFTKCEITDTIEETVKELTKFEFTLKKISIILNEEHLVLIELNHLLRQFHYVIVYTDFESEKEKRAICNASLKLFKEDISDAVEILRKKYINGVKGDSLNIKNIKDSSCSVICIPRMFVIPRSSKGFKLQILKDLNGQKFTCTLKNEKDILEHIKDNVEVFVECKGSEFFYTLLSSDLIILLDAVNSLKRLDVIIVKDNNSAGLFFKPVYFNKHIIQSIQYIEECFQKYGPQNVFFCFNGGKDCTVLLHLTLIVLKNTYPDLKQILFIYVRHQNAFEEVDNFIRNICEHYNLEILTFSKSIKESLRDILEDRPNMRACLMGTRRTDPHSQHLDVFTMTDGDWPRVMRVNPILEWHYYEIWDYLLRFNVPYCNLYDLGYTSLGGKNNTVPNDLLLCGEKKYLPAYKLLDPSQERNGRMKS